MCLQPSWFPRLWNAAPAVAASSGLWLFLASRWLLHWRDGPLKSTVLVSSLASLLLIGLGLAVWRPVVGGLAPLFLLGAFSMGEVRRAWIRHDYRRDSPAVAVVPHVHQSNLFTTTAIELVRYRIPWPSDGFGSLRVVHLTDFHVSPALPLSYFQQVLDTALSQDPDLLLLTGDFISGRAALPLLSQLLDRDLSVPLGTYFVLGNHDHWTDPEAVSAVLQRHALQPLAGRCRCLAVGGRTFRVCGTEEPWGAPAPLFDEESEPVIVLSHTPDNIYELAARGASAVFAGHTHGGQVRLPWLGALLVPSRYGRRFDRGYFRVRDTHLFVSAGIGADRPPLRVSCPPQIIVVDWLPR